MQASKDILYTLANCPLEIVLSLKFVVGLIEEDSFLWETEKEYLSSFMYYLQIYGDPRGRGNYASKFSLMLMWKLSMIAHYFKKSMDAEFTEEIFDACLFCLE
jgi:hypothetical protein